MNITFDKEYAGIGSRKLSKKNARKFITFAFVRALSGWKVRSGAADGADTAFEVGARLAYRFLSEINPEKYPKGQYNIVQEIFIPWSNFNGRKDDLKAGYSSKISKAEIDLAIKYHPAGDTLKQSLKNLMARNVLQILGREINGERSLVNEVICYTPDGAETKTNYKTGGTGQAIRIANDFNIPVFNLVGEQGADHIDNVIQEGVKDWPLDITVQEYVNDYIDKYTGFKNSHKRSIVDVSSADVIVHGCNCLNTMGAGIARVISQNWPESSESDNRTKRADKNKLGTFSSANIKLKNGKDCTIINAYTQFDHSGPMDELLADYEAIRKIFKELNTLYKGKVIVFPKIGAGTANGDWFTISNIIRTELKDCKLMLVDIGLVT